MNDKEFKLIYNDYLNLLGILKLEVEQSDIRSALESFDFLTENLSELKSDFSKQQLEDIQYIFRSYLKKIEKLDEENYLINERNKLKSIL